MKRPHHEETTEMFLIVGLLALVFLLVALGWCGLVQS